MFTVNSELSERQPTEKQVIVMSTFNSQASIINQDVHLDNNFQTNSQHSIDANQGVQVIYSNLQPTATEFQPSSSSNGAFKRDPIKCSYNKPNKGLRTNGYGSGRIFNNKGGFKQKKEKSEEELFSREFFYNRTRNSYAHPNSDYKQNVQQVKHSHFNTSTHVSRNYYDGHLNDYLFTNTPDYQDQVKSHSQINLKKENYEQFGESERLDYQFHNKLEKPYNKLRKGSNNQFDRKGMTFNKKYDENKPNKLQVKNCNRNFQETNHSEEKDNVNYKSANKTLTDKSQRNVKFEKKRLRDYKSQFIYNKGNIQTNFMKIRKGDAASQKERLEEMIYNRILECLVCCEKIKNNDKVWSCQLCYHILHLHCVTAWAKSSKVENGWRCPACQNVCSEVPSEYKCYCGKNIEPKISPSTIAHGCGEICLRKGRTCDHKCTLLCHPGPCPDCSIMVTKTCGCLLTSPVVKCSTAVEIVCGNICNKFLECGLHHCKETCHSGNCNLCSEIIRQECYCGKVGRKVPCRAQYCDKSKYECGEVCGKQLSCGNHSCKKLCHEGPCECCIRDVKEVHTCPCGKTHLEKTRESCLDPIPCCSKICGKLLKCGQSGFRHTCKQTCHEGDCPPCPLSTVVRCRCGHMDKELPCQEAINPGDTRCEKKCTRKRLCGKHKCNQRCCIEVDHICPLPCNHLLTCGQHRCDRTCHSGRCTQCIETSFEELYCECGVSVLYPPIPCGTKPPACNMPCSRPRSCEHEANHNCHTGPCPPCTVLCKKWCYGHHEQRFAVLCYQHNFSCGLSCGKEMPCGRHKCNKPCHSGPCPTICNQPCTIPRRLCGHICGKPCHDIPCPESSCKQTVVVTCICGLQKSTKPCIEVTEEFKNMEMAQLKEKIGVSSKDQAVDISDIVRNSVKPTVLKTLDCNEDCRILERNRRLAIGLQIINPDLSQKLTPKYSDFMRQWSKRDPYFCQRIHNKLTDLVQLAKQSKQKSRSCSFESMNKDKRNFVHEYCEHFGVESAAYDSEPNRNVVATAIRDKSWLPSMSLLEVIQRENGQRKVPGPIIVSNKSVLGKSESVSVKLLSRALKPVSLSSEDYFLPQ